jgi:hypothetical protein
MLNDILRTTRSIACCALIATIGCNETGVGPAPVDTTEPVPIDARGSGFATYKGLPLELVDNGAPDVEPVDGIVGLVCVGMSNGNQECEDFRTRLLGEYSAEVDPAVRVVNCAVGGHAIERWIDPAFDEALWERCIEQRLPEAGVRVEQVRVIWHKAANQFTTLPGGGAKPLYPASSSDYEAFSDNLTLFAARVPAWFPRVQAVYTSSRSYGGFAESPARGEPLSYEEGHALNAWLTAHASVDGVWQGWAAYLWAPDCATGETNGSGICYDVTDFVADGVHPSETGRAKVSELLHTRFLQEDWYRRR